MEKSKMPSGQKSAFHNDFPVGQTGAKEARKTGKMSGGTSALRAAKDGKPHNKVTNT